MLTLISGGARSGKSQLAIDIASKSDKDIVFCATAEALDEEMVARIDMHQKSRPSDWELVEEPMQIAKVIRNLGDEKLLIIDCMTMYVSNLLCADFSDEEIQAAVKDLLNVIKEKKLDVIIVTNEVGLGIVPENKLARRFRDIAGWINQDVAVASDQVFICFLGQRLKLK